MASEKYLSTTRVSESTLQSDLSELSHSLVRELAMACKKVAIYGSHHPLSVKALERPFLLIAQIGRFKKHINFNLQQGCLYVLGIRLKESLFTSEIIQVMQIQDTKALIIGRMIAMADFTILVDRLVKRVDTSDSANSLSNFLKDRDIPAEANSEKGFALFENSKQYRGDVDGDFSVRHLILDRLGDSLVFLARANTASDDQLEVIGIDYDIDIIRYLLPEKIASFSTEAIRTELATLCAQPEGAAAADTDISAIEMAHGLVSLLDYHPDREKIIANLHIPPSGGVKSEDELTASKWPEDGTVSTAEDSNNFLTTDESTGGTDSSPEEFRNTFGRILKTVQHGRAIAVVSQLMDCLQSPDADERQDALEMLLICVQEFNPAVDGVVIEDCIEKIVDHIRQKRETYEYSELIWALLHKLIVSRSYQPAATLASGLAVRRHLIDSATVYDSIAVKKVFNDLNRPEVVKTLVDEMVLSSHPVSGHIRDLLIAVGSEEIAFELSRIISHPVRQVRQQTLKILAELGKASLKVFSRIIMDDARFERESGRQELADSKWYIVRNSIFTLGSLHDPAAIVPLRLRISDPDIRVRREIVRSLEKIGGEDACDLLIMMAEDAVREISEAAVIAVGAIGTPDIAPQLINLITTCHQIVPKTMLSLARIGGETARDYLVGLLENPQRLIELQGGQYSRDDLQLALIKALGNIGDDQSIGKIKQFREDLTGTQKIFFKMSPVSKEISSILSRNR